MRRANRTCSSLSVCNRKPAVTRGEKVLLKVSMFEAVFFLIQKKQCDLQNSSPQDHSTIEMTSHPSWPTPRHGGRETYLKLVFMKLKKTKQAKLNQVASSTRCRGVNDFFWKVHLTHDSSVSFNLKVAASSINLTYKVSLLGKNTSFSHWKSTCLQRAHNYRANKTQEQVSIVLFIKTLMGQVSFPVVTLRFRLSMIFGALSDSFVIAKFNLIC